MVRFLKEFWRREDGTSSGLEWVLVAEVMVLGTIAAVVLLRNAANGN
jgi:hypothetical protein